jgi:hypothetical protein
MTFLHGAQRDIIDRTGSTPAGAVKALQALTGSFLQGVESRGRSRHVADRTGPSFRAWTGDRFVDRVAGYSSATSAIDAMACAIVAASA